MEVKKISFKPTRLEEKVNISGSKTNIQRDRKYKENRYDSLRHTLLKMDSEICYKRSKQQDRRTGEEETGIQKQSLVCS